MDLPSRNLDDLRCLVRLLTGKGVRVEFAKGNLAFTSEDSPMAALLLSVMGAFSEFERALILERQREGIAAAKASGVYTGRKPALTPQEANELRERGVGGEKKLAGPWTSRSGRPGRPVRGAAHLRRPHPVPRSRNLPGSECKIGRQSAPAVGHVARFARIPVSPIDARFTDWRIGACAHFASLCVDHTFECLEKILDGGPRGHPRGSVHPPSPQVRPHRHLPRDGRDAPGCGTGRAVGVIRRPCRGRCRGSCR
ncbi:recombinase family protein [Nonomuraea jabiensis]|uniref:Resolvase/invertase-type recombinase catalytic domain-containing protein n=1 Tax=Nonomuraea jabiensis TaxID=882448 RepID=A0A7W9GGT1_9ACTN|nr:hypothetical protein [Nonomuraea jabiensis]